MNSIYKEIHYIYWSKESKLIHLSQEQLRDKVKSLKDYELIKYTSLREAYIGKKYSIKKSDDWCTLYIVEDGKYVRYCSNWFDSTKVNSEGGNAVKLVSDKFEELTGTTMKSAFDTVSEEFKRCIPKQFYYTNKKYMDKELIFSSIDACSQYPAHMCGKLPDAHTAIRLNGTVEPTEEYPFAFYIKSGHVAEYKVFDTHNWFSYTPFEQCLFRTNEKYWAFHNVPYNEDETVLMKASKYELTDVYNYFYNIKQTYEQDTEDYNDAKLVMNASIGKFHQKKYRNYKYAHLVAIAIARGNQHILEMAYKINPMFIAQICVDGIIYLGSQTFGNSVKQLGNYYQEFTGALGKISSINRYIMMQDGKVIKAKWSGCNRTIDGKPITEETITSLDDQYGWYKEDFLKEIMYEEKVQEE